MATPAAPSLSARSVAGGVVVTMSGFSNISRFRIERKVNNGGWSIIASQDVGDTFVSPYSRVDFGPRGYSTYNGDGPNYGLPSETFSYRARVWDAVVTSSADISPYSTTVSASPGSVPVAGTPTGLTASAGNASVILSWTAGANNDRWEIEWTGPRQTTPARFSWHRTSRAMRNLDNGETYRFRVRGRSDHSTVDSSIQTASAWTDWVSASPFDAGPTLPRTPSGLSATPSDRGATLSWDNPHDPSITHYELYQTNISQGGGTGYVEISGSGSGTTSHTVSGLQNGIEYQFALRAINNVGDGGASIVRVVPNNQTNPIPATPTGVTLNSPSTSITVSWDDPSDSTITRYEYQIDLESWAVVSGSNASTVSFTVTGLVIGEGHSFRIRAVNANGTSPATQRRYIEVGREIPVDTSENGPAQPTGLSASAVAGVITLTWNDPNDNNITSYEYSAGGGNWVVMSGADADTTSHAISNLPPNKTYVFIIRAINSFGPSLPSNSVSVSNPLPVSVLYTLNSSPSTSAGLWALNSDDISPLTGSYGNLGSLIDSLISDAIAYEDETKLWLARGSRIYLIDPRDPDNTATPYGQRAFNLVNVSYGGIDLEGDTALWAIENAGSSNGRIRRWLLSDLATTTSPFNIHGLQGIHPFAPGDSIVGFVYQDSSTMWGITGNWRLYKINPADVTQTSDGYGLQGTNFISHRVAVDHSPSAVTLERDNVLLISCGHHLATDAFDEYLIRLDCTNLDNTEDDFGFVSYFPSGLQHVQGIALTARKEVAPVDEADSVSERAISSLTGTPSARLIQLRWGVILGAVSYELAYWVQFGDKWVIVDETITGTAWTHGNLSESTFYWYSLRPVFADGTKGSWSETISVSTLAVGVPSAPRSLVAESQDDGVTISWLEPQDDGGSSISRYELWRWSRGVWESVSDTILSSDTTFVDEDDLDDGEWYWYQMRAVNVNGNGEWSETSSVLIGSDGGSPTPSAPRRLTADAQSTGVVLSWLAPAESGTGGAITGYSIWRWYNDTWTEVEDDTGSTSTSYTDTTTLTDGEWYWYIVRAINASGNGEWSETSSALINPSLPSAVRRFVGDAQSSGVVLDWLAPVDAGTGGAITGYNIWRWHNNTWTEVVSNTGSTTTNYTDTTTLTVGEWYWYNVRAINTSGSGEWAQNVAVNINPSVPSQPRRLIVTEVNTGIALSWQAPVDTGTGGSITGYNIWRYDGSSWSELVSNTGNTNVLYTDTSTLPSGWIWYAVRAINTSGNGEWSETSGITTSESLPSPVRSLTLEERATGVRLRWSTPYDNGGSAITGYRIWRSNGVSWTQLVADTGSISTTYDDTTDLASGVWWYRVNALNSSGAGDFSSTASIAIGDIEEGPSTPSSPRRLRADAQSNGVVMSWLAPVDTGTGGSITGYEVWRNDGMAWVRVDVDADDTDTSDMDVDYTDTSDLTDGATYAYAVRAVNASAPSVSFSGGSGTGATAVVTVDGGEITAITVTDGGSGYTSTPNVAISGGGGSGATATATVAGGKVTAVTVTNGGSEYESGVGEWSATVTITVNPTLPSAPRRLTVDAQSSGVVLGWLAPIDSGTGGAITGYSIYRNGGSGWTRIENDTGNTNLTYTDSTSLVEDSVYLYAVRALNASGLGEWSETISVIINPTLPSAPRRFSADAQSTGVVTSWLAPVDPGSGGAITGYRILRSTNGSTWVNVIADTGNTDLTYTDKISVLTVAFSGGGGSGAVASAIVIGGSITGFTIINGGSGYTSTPNVAISGGGGSGATATATVAGGKVTAVTVTNGGSGYESAFIDGATYYYAARAINSSGLGEWSAIVPVVINPGVPSAPRQLVLTETDSGIILNWLAPSDTGLGGTITGYNIRRFSNGAWADVVANTMSTDLTYTDSSDLSMGWHWWSVRAINGSGYGEWSETSGVTTATNVPSRPISLIAVLGNDGVVLSWDEPENNGGAEIEGYRIWRNSGSEWVEIVTDTDSTDTTYTDTMVESLGAGVYFYRVNAITSNGHGDFSEIASVQVAGTITILMPTRVSEEVFGNWWISVIPEIVNPNDDTLAYEWFQSGGITISSTDSSSTYIKFPNGTTERQNVSLTLTVTNIITNKTKTETISYSVVPEPPRASVFHNGINSSIPGVVWYGWNQVWEYEGFEDVGLIDSRRYETRDFIPVNSSYVNTHPAYMTAWTLRGDGSMLLNLSGASDDPDYGSSGGPQFTDAAESNLGLAARLPDGSEYKWTLSALTTSDSSEPYLFSATAVSTAGDANTQALRNKMDDFWNIRLVLLDRTNTFINWGDLETLAIDPSVSIDVVDDVADSGKTQTISGTFDDFQDEFKDITLSIGASEGTLGDLQKDNLSGFWNINWTAPEVTSGTTSTTITATVRNSLNRTVSDTTEIVTHPIFEPTIPDNTIVNQVISIQPEDQLKDLTNIIKAPIRQFNVTDEVELWSLQESVELGPGTSRSFLLNYPDDAAPRSHLAVHNWFSMKLNEDPEFVFGPSRNTFGKPEGDVDDARRERNRYAQEEREWFDEYKNSSSLMVRLLGASRSGAIYETYTDGEWVEVSPKFPDYAANSQSDGNGNDRTSDLELEVDDGGNTRRIIVKNTNLTDTIYLTELRSRGRVIQEIQKTTIEIREDTSVERYGPKDHISASQFLSTIAHAHEYGTNILWLYSEPTLKAKVMFEVNDYLFLAYSLQLSDRVALTRKGETEDFFVECIEHMIEPGFFHCMQVTLSAAPEEQAIILGTGPPLGTGVLAR